MIQKTENRLLVFAGFFNLSLARLLVGFLFLFVFSSLYSQEDTTRFEGVTIVGNHKLMHEQGHYDRSEINALAPADLGVLLKRVAGATVADYGGIGSMKTLSVRGLGSTHAGLIVNGYPRSNPQNSQVDFSQIQLDNIEEATVLLGPSNQLEIPVSSRMKGSIIALSTFEQTFAQQPFALRLSSTVGSFGRKEVHASLKVGNEQSFLSFSGNLRGYEGDFVYEHPFSNEELIRRRKNNDLTSHFFSLGGGRKWRTGKNQVHRLRFFGNLNHIDRSLPGAIILYTQSSTEHLLTQHKNVGGDYSYLGKKLKFRTFLSAGNDQLRYQDPDYYNQQGFIDNIYQNQFYHTGLNGSWKFKRFLLDVGNDLRYDDLFSSKDLGEPQRLVNIGMIGGKINLNYFDINASLFHHYIYDQNNSGEHRKQYNRLNPQFSVTTSDKLFDHLQFSLWYKLSSRAPSFNELYFSQIGNTSLLPEESEQTNLGYSWVWKRKKLSGSLKGNVFFNRVLNKIVAIPTQNLFVWAIQNVGNVLSYGKDFTFDLSYSFSSETTLSFSSTTAFQKVTDRSSRQNPTFGHQIANTPVWTNASDIQLNVKKFSFGVASLFMGKRYALNENIAMNALDSYTVFDFTASYAVDIRNKHNLSIQAGIRNIANQHYFHINYFVMPGRSYFLRVSYEL
jgi:outer membrane cobalamin receptor